VRLRLCVVGSTCNDFDGWGAGLLLHIAKLSSVVLRGGAGHCGMRAIGLHDSRPLTVDTARLHQRARDASKQQAPATQQLTVGVYLQRGAAG
jgi:hypothetical protein